MTVIDMSKTCAPKSDQLNSDDLISGPRTITVTKVTANEGSAEQPVNVFFHGDNGKPYRPCKQVRRIMVQVWGCDATKYVGRSMTIYRDPEVMWGGMKVGGIRVSHMSHIDSAMTVMATVTRTSRKPVSIQPLADQAAKSKPSVAEFWGRDSYRIQVKASQDGNGSDWESWAFSMKKAALAAPDDKAREKLMIDNAPALEAFRSVDDAASSDLFTALGADQPPTGWE